MRKNDVFHNIGRCLWIKMNTHRTKRLGSGRYLYRGFVIERYGYLHEDGRIRWVGWQAKAHNGSTFGQSFSLSESKKAVDYVLDVLPKIK